MKKKTGIVGSLTDQAEAGSVIGELLDRKAKELVKKGEDISNADLYNLCLVNKLRDELNK